jgi:hypothetical protein
MICVYAELTLDPSFAFGSGVYKVFSTFQDKSLLGGVAFMDTVLPSNVWVYGRLGM